VLRLIAGWKFVKAAAVLGVAAGAVGLMSADRALAVQGWLEAFILEPGHRTLAHLAGRALSLLNVAGPGDLRRIVAGAVLLAILFVVEGVGLALARRWAEWLTVAVTTSYLPLEIVALSHRWTVPRVLTVALNIAVIVYLLVQLRAQRGPRVSSLRPE
jgi:uncharacterized membrane protein (DUF2068 family)